MTEKVTMAQVWEELDEIERKVLTEMVGIAQGQLALMKISNVLKAIAYRYQDKSPNDYAQIEILRQQYAAELQKHILEMDQRYKMAELQKQYYPSTTTNTGTMPKKWHDLW